MILAVLSLSLAVFGTPTPGAEPPAAPRQIPQEQEPAVDWTVPALHTTGLFLGMRATEAYLWPAPFAETDLSVIGRHYREAYTHPPVFDRHQRAFEWDGDHWTLNVVGHGLLGSELFYRPRRCGASMLEAFAFAAASSAVWEYVFEANGVRPSALDLTYTPLVGLVLGEARHAGYTAAARIPNRTLRGILKGVLDPFGEFERALGAQC